MNSTATTPMWTIFRDETERLRGESEAHDEA